MIKSLIASLALSTLCIPQVNAQTYTENDLLNDFEAIGGRVYVDSELCKENPKVCMAWPLAQPSTSAPSPTRVTPLSGRTPSATRSSTSPSSATKDPSPPTLPRSSPRHTRRAGPTGLQARPLAHGSRGPLRGRDLHTRGDQATSWSNTVPNHLHLAMDLSLIGRQLRREIEQGEEARRRLESQTRQPMSVHTAAAPSTDRSC